MCPVSKPAARTARSDPRHRFRERFDPARETACGAFRFDAIVLAVEIDLTVSSPEGMTDRQKLLGARISLVVREKIAVAVLLHRRAAGDDVQGDAPADQSQRGC